MGLDEWELYIYINKPLTHRVPRFFLCLGGSTFLYSDSELVKMREGADTHGNPKRSFIRASFDGNGHSRRRIGAKT